MPKIKTSISTSSDEFKANAAAMQALVADLGRQARRGRGGRAREAARASRGARQAAAARPRAAADRSGLAVPGAVAAGGARHVREGHPRCRHHHRGGPHLGARVRDRVQRRHHQGRHLFPDDGEEAPARAGDRAREPAAVHLPCELGGSQPAGADRGVPRPRALRPHLLQPGDACRRSASRRSRA